MGVTFDERVSFSPVVPYEQPWHRRTRIESHCLSEGEAQSEGQKGKTVLFVMGVFVGGIVGFFGAALMAASD